MSAVDRAVRMSQLGLPVQNVAYYSKHTEDNFRGE